MGAAKVSFTYHNFTANTFQAFDMRLIPPVTAETETGRKRVGS
jgi:hypothetical protein